MRILILGGTIEARQLAERLSARRDVSVTLSLAGRTAAPRRPDVPLRIGGFGGSRGLADYLTTQGIDLLIDATHPYAAVMSAHAAAAGELSGVRLLVLRRTAWRPVAGDDWREVADVADAVPALGRAPRRVFLTLGRNEIAAFQRAPQHHYLIRSVDPVDPPLAVPHASYLVARGPFSEAHDRDLMTTHRIEMLVAKNSGGTATYGKIAAARALRIPVILLRRPAPAAVPGVDSVDAVVAEIDHALTR